MKQLILLSLIITIGIQPCSSKNNNNLGIIKTDTISLAFCQININQAKEICELKKTIELQAVKESLFCHQLTILTTLLSVIVTLAIFVVGFIIPKLKDKKYQNKINKIKEEFEAIKKEINANKEETNRVDLETQYNNSRTMFFICYSMKYKNGTLLWGLKHVSDTLSRYPDNADMNDIRTIINEAEASLQNLEIEKEGHSKTIDIINELLSELIIKIKDESLLNTLNNIKVGFNKIVWCNIENN